MGAPRVILCFRAMRWALLADSYRVEAGFAKYPFAAAELLHAANGCYSIIRRINEARQ
jgi:hypothetical protein